MRRPCVVLLVLLCSAAVARADVPPPWSAQESWPAGTQYDSRLDRTVQFWGTAIPLATVFAGIEEQTGVDVACSPAGDANERVCVNLYLNPTQPPTLRELLTQLGWVTGCTFVFLAEDPPRYVLLSTDVGRTVATQFAEAQEQLRALNAEYAARRRQDVRATLDDLDRVRDALALTPEQAIARYRGSNDYLLLALLAPERRAALEAVYALTPEQHEALAARGFLSVRLSELPREQQDEFAELLGLRPPLSDQRRLQLSVGQSYLNAYTWGPEGQGNWSGTVRLTPGVMAPDSYDGLQLRAALGEPIDLEAERRRLQGPGRQQGLDRFEQYMEEQAAAIRRTASLSPRAEAQLSAWEATWSEEASYPLWQVQEAAAQATGAHVVSDCFAQPSRQPEYLQMISPEYRREQRARQEEIQRFEQEHREEWNELMRGDGFRKRFPPLVHTFTLRELLTALCYSEAEAPLGYLSEETALGWEWGDAGTFLRFRSRHPDIWRAALLPPAALQILDASLAPRPSEAGESESPDDMSRALPISEQLALIRLLDDVQLRLGGLILREDPNTPTGAARTALTRQLWAHFSEALPALRFLAGLDDSQWAQLLGPGLSAARDLTAQQRDQLLAQRDYYISGFAVGQGTEASNLLVTVRAEDSATGPRHVDDIVSLRVSSGGGASGGRNEWQVRPYLGLSQEKPPVLPPFHPVSP